MQKLLEHYTIHLDPALYCKDPVSSDVGKEILRESTRLLAKEGIESFTFKKLALAMTSTETTVYRYFQNKHQLVMYLSSWYWLTLEWKIVFATANINDPSERLHRAIQVLASKATHEPGSSLLNVELLQCIASKDALKVFDLEIENEKIRKGYYSAYNELCERISEIILTCNRHYKYPKALASTLVDTSHRQLFFREHIPSLTDAGKNERQSQQFLLTLVTHIL